MRWRPCCSTACPTCRRSACLGSNVTVCIAGPMCGTAVSVPPAMGTTVCCALYAFPAYWRWDFDVASRDGGWMDGNGHASDPVCESSSSAGWVVRKPGTGLRERPCGKGSRTLFTQRGGLYAGGSWVDIVPPHTPGRLCEVRLCQLGSRNQNHVYHSDAKGLVDLNRPHCTDGNSITTGVSSHDMVRIIT